jgi:hypothetical protein
MKWLMGKITLLGYRFTSHRKQSTDPNTGARFSAEYAAENPKENPIRND